MGAEMLARLLDREGHPVCELACGSPTDTIILLGLDVSRLDEADAVLHLWSPLPVRERVFTIINGHGPSETGVSLFVEQG